MIPGFEKHLTGYLTTSNMSICMCSRMQRKSHWRSSAI
jgi:hypothetical protein